MCFKMAALLSLALSLVLASAGSKQSTFAKDGTQIFLEQVSKSEIRTSGMSSSDSEMVLVYLINVLVCILCCVCI
jgi:hypothetical protein